MRNFPIEILAQNNAITLINAIGIFRWLMWNENLMKTKISRGQIRETKTSFGPTRHVGIARGLAEFRSGRPVVFRAKHSIIAMPIDGCDAPRLNSFSRLSETTPPSLGITGQRARAIGIKTDMALSVDLKSYPTIDEILSIAMINQPDTGDTRISPLGPVVRSNLSVITDGSRFCKFNGCYYCSL